MHAKPVKGVICKEQLILNSFIDNSVCIHYHEMQAPLEERALPRLERAAQFFPFLYNKFQEILNACLLREE